MAHLYYTNIQDIRDKNCINDFRKLVSKERLSQLDKFYFKEDYLRSLLGEVIIRKKVAEFTGIKPEAVELYKNICGKPFIINVPDIYFNISHSGNWVVCLLAENPCGVDIEKILEMHMDIAQYFFSKYEYEFLQKADKRLQKELFYELWTLKESFVKYNGKGFYMPLNSFEFIKIGNIWELRQVDDQNLFFKQPFIAEEYKVAVCIQREKLFFEKLIL